MLTMC